MNPRRPVPGLLTLAALAAVHSAPAVRAGGCEPYWVTGEPVPGLARIEVRDFAVHDDGSGPALFMGGQSVEIAGTLRASGVVRWDGTDFSGIGDVLSGGAGSPGVNALAVYGGRLVIAGSFASVGGVPANNIAAWDGTSWSALGSGVSGGVGGVWDLLVHDGKLVATGSFNTAGGVASANVAVWDGTSWSALGGGVSGSSATGRALASFEGDLICGGTFLLADGDTVEHIARWDGTAWSAIGGGLPGSVYALAAFDLDGGGPDPERLIAGGGFGSSGIDDLAWWDGSSWQELGNGTQNTVFALLPSGDDLLVGGFFTGVGGGAGNAEHVARWTPGAGWSALGAGVSSDVGGVEVFALAEFGGDVYAGGNFGFSDQHAMHRVARWDGTRWNALSPGMGGAYGAAILDILPWGDDAIVAGAFTSVGDGIDANNVARWTPTGWASMGHLGNGVYHSSRGGEWVEDLAVHGGEIHAAWYDYNGTGLPGARISRWDGAAWQQIVATTGANQNILVLQSHGGDLYAGGAFTNVGGFSASRIIRWDGTTWFPLGTGLNGEARAMIPFEGDLLVGGAFSTAGGAPAFRVARWDGVSWTAMGTGLPGLTFSVDCFAFHDGALCAGTSGGVYRWDGAAWTQIVGVAGVESLTSTGSDLYLAGRFTSAAGVPGADRVARWDGADTHAVGTGLGGGASSTGFGFGLPGAYALAVLADGSIAVGTNDLPLADGEVSYGFARIVPCSGTSAGEPVAAGAWADLRLAALRLGDGRAAFELLLPGRGDATLTVHDVSGREVARWHEAGAAAGRRVLALEELVRGGPAASGVYFARLKARAGEDIASRVVRAVHLR